MSIVGIDLGTTNSLVATLTDDGPVCLTNEMDEALIPSAIAWAEDGTRLVGRAAKDRLAVAPDAGVAFFKRDMGTSRTYTLQGRPWTPVECSAAILQEMRRIAALRLGSDVTQAVITVPAYFNDNQRQATVEAARIAGLRVERIINEPTAAALAFGHQHQGDDRTLVVIDLGGGTFDVTVLETFSGVVEVRATGGDGRLGGEDWTDALLATVAQRLGGTVDHGRLRPAVEVAKRRLCTGTEVLLPWGDRSIALTRDDLITAGRPLCARLRPVILRCLRDTGLRPEDIHEVLLVGGASRLPDVQALVTTELGAKVNRRLDPDRAIALGAAVQAGLCAGNAAVQDLVLTDVCPHTLGVGVAKELAPGIPTPGFFSPIIERNTTLPVSRVESFQTVHPEQDSIRLQIFQGEARMTKDNIELGTLQISGIPTVASNPANTGSVEVRFTYDMNGILEVEATLPGTAKVFRTVIEQRPGSLTSAQVDEALRKLAPLKTHPRNLLPNRARLERANRLFAELTGPARAILTSHTDDFEAALASQDPEKIRVASAILDQFLRQFYQEEGEGRPLDGAPA